MLDSETDLDKIDKKFWEKHKGSRRKKITVLQNDSKVTYNITRWAATSKLGVRECDINQKNNLIPEKWTEMTKRKVRSFRTLKTRIFVHVLFLLLLFQTARTQEDRRCFLQRGGSVQNFFVSESLPVGHVIGELEIVGDASENGDIYLRLDNPNFSPVRISPNSKQIILTEKLDKEGKDGRSHIVISVICQKRKMDDVTSYTIHQCKNNAPVFINSPYYVNVIEDIKIPINIRVTDANDNAPVFINSPYYVNVSEATVTNTIIKGDITASDDDQIGPFSEIRYSVAPGHHSSKFSFESPLSGSLQLREPLDYEADSLFNITIIAEDRGSPPKRTETFVTVQVSDSDDQNPVFGKQRYMTFLPNDLTMGNAFEVQPEPISAHDQDKGIRAKIFYALGNDVPEASYLSIEPNTGEIFITEDIPENAFLQPVALSVIATQVDNSDRTATVILTISRRGTTSTQLQFLQRIYEKTVNENLPKGTLITKTLINKKPQGPIRFFLERDGIGIFSISAHGGIFLERELDYETRKEYSLKVFVTEGEYNDTASLKVKVLNVNDWDPRFEYPQYAFHVDTNSLQPGDTIGRVAVADGDGDEISLNVMGTDSKMFSISPTGEINVRRLISLNSTVANIVLVARDSGKPPRQTSVPVAIHLPHSVVEIEPIEMSASFLLMVIFGSLVAVFVFIIICLAVYIHKHKKFRDDNGPATPTKMNHIIAHGGTSSKLDSLSSLSHQHQDAASDVTGIEAPRSNGSILEANNHFKRSYTNGSFRASTISVRSNEPDSTRDGTPHRGSRRYSKNPLANGAALGGRGVISTDGGDSLSLNGSNATTTSTATAGSDSPPAQGSRSSTPNIMSRFFASKSSSITPANGSISSFCTLDGTARATGGVPNNSTRTALIPPAPALPPALHHTLPRSNPAVPPKSCLERPPTSSALPPDRKSGTLSRVPTGDRKICWPPTSIPKKVKKLSWEDELNSQTEMNPEVSVMPMPPNEMSQQNEPNLTVYF